MKELFEMCKAFFESITEVVTFVIDFIGDIVDVVKLIGSSIPQIPSYLSFLPAWLVTSFVGIFTIVAVYKIVGRD